ncbi:GNAT family N-acetyltransferase [Brevibacterium sp. p3-SID960]|uniref:GNAT family N-acetyltransferase n=1 Tax=Brevibacterium sp. p3-SID960 TaxID=2916063 RepID=UPI0021A9478F|nr:GNAT family N-acetyltransferase [Brevibacterium sp. p3-SID960]MCT1690878.1 GNAT family N-acetyltransferase [Brevibacterium sp. p3-SID960]
MRSSPSAARPLATFPVVALLADDPGQLLLVIEAPGPAPEVAGTCQQTFIPGISRHGMLHARIEAVRIRADRSGQGLGTALFRWAIAHARSCGCGLLQLTTDRSRTDRSRAAAHRFYDRLGFTASHTGYKLLLT